MERLLVLKLVSLNCEAEAWLNGMPIARVAPDHPVASVPVHEYTVAGSNRLALVIAPTPAGEVADTAPPPVRQALQKAQAAQLRLLLPRMGNAAADEETARGLAQLDWAAAAGELVATPLSRQQDVTLPINFPRWRWLEAPRIESGAALGGQVFELLQTLAFDLGRGEFESFIEVARLRFEELALAYQRTPADEIRRWREHMQRAHAAGRLQWRPLNPTELRLRRLADGRLVDAIAPDGRPVLRTVPDADGKTLALALRLAVVENKLYVLR